MAASPTRADIAEWSSIVHAAQWAGFRDLDQESSSGRGLIAHLGFEPEDALAELGSVSAADYASEVSKWTFDDAPPTLAMKSRANRLGHASRVFVGIDYTVAATQAYEQAELEHNRELEWFAAKQSADAAAAAGASSPATPAAIVVAPAAARKVGFRDVADSGRADEVPVLDFNEMDRMRTHYKKVTGSKKGPPPSTEPTAEQMSTLSALLKERSAPYTDFALWGPYGGRTLRKILNSGLTFGPDGALIRSEFRGPPSFEHWKACWAVYEVAMVMANAASAPVLTAYAAHIESMAKQFGPICWRVLYQTENRYRREQLEILRRSESDALDRSLAAGGTHPFDPLQPWERCYDIAEDQYHYWNKNVTIPSLMIVAKARAAGYFIDGDSEVATSDALHIATSHQGEIFPMADVGGGGSSSNKRAAGQVLEQPTKRTRVKDASTPRVHNVTNGLFTTNRSGKQLCSAFQTGDCKGLTTDCPAHKAHQCAKCLQTLHGSNTCKASPGEPPRGPTPKGKGGGRGKGGKRR